MDYLEYREYLAHHGIQGQKWGVRNGPPYPLDEKVAEVVMSQNRVPLDQILAKNKKIDDYWINDLDEYYELADSFSRNEYLKYKTNIKEKR